MTPEIIARVDAWLASRKEWLLATEYRDWLHHEWRLAVDRYSSHERADAREAVAACLTGLLLALVREAWCGVVTIRETDGRANVIYIETELGRLLFAAGGPMAERRLATLEAAPR